MSTSADRDSVPGFHDVLKPSKEILLNGFRWFVYTPKDLGTTLVCLEDLETGTVVTTPLMDPSQPAGSFKAWSGGRHSRASGSPLEIMLEIKERNTDTDKKVGGFVNEYGHVSLGDMAGAMMVHFYNVPMHFPMTMFNFSSVHAGQEKSTRYQQKFGQALLHKLNNYLRRIPEEKRADISKGFENLGKEAMEIFHRHKPSLLESLKRRFKPQDKKEENSLNSRNLDIVRGSLLMGLGTGFSFETSAREWSQVISKLKASHIAYYQMVASQVEMLLSPPPEVEQSLDFRAEAPSLIRHTEASSRANTNLVKLDKYIRENTDILEVVSVSRNYSGEKRQEISLTTRELSSGEKIVVQYLTALYPGLNRVELSDRIMRLPDNIKEQLGVLITDGHNNYEELPHIAGTGDLTVSTVAQLKVVRDLDRHRPWDREIGVPLVYGGEWSYDKAMQIISKGFALSLYLTGIPELASNASQYSHDMGRYYQNLLGYLGSVHKEFGDSIDYTFVVNLLPLAHLVDFVMNGNPRQSVYLTNQRVRNGGDIDYRILAYYMNRLVADSDPFLKSTGMDETTRPDPENRFQFFDRS